MRGRRFEKLVAETKTAIARGDVEEATKLLRRFPAGYERVAANLLFDYSSPLGRKEPPDLLLVLYAQARAAARSLIDAYAQRPEAVERIVKKERPSDSGAGAAPPES